jgi:hypothetical protein
VGELLSKYIVRIKKIGLEPDASHEPLANVWISEEVLQSLTSLSKDLCTKSAFRIRCQNENASAVGAAVDFTSFPCFVVETFE